MRLVHVLIPAGRREAVLRELDEEGVDYALTPEIGREEYEAEVSFPLPATAVEPVLNRLREVGIEEDGFTVVLAAETVVSKRFEAALHEEIGEVLDREQYSDVRFVEAHVDVSPLRHVLFGEEIEVTVIVDTTGDPPPEELAEDLRRTIAAEQGFDAIVIVEPVDASLPSDDERALRPAPTPAPAR